MKDWLRGMPGGLLAFVLIAGLVAGGLGWATAAALRLEREQLEERAAAVRAIQLRLALGRMDAHVAPLLAREDGRPFNHYGTLYPPPLALTNTGVLCQPGVLLEPTPLLHADLPAWMLLHFQVDAEGWESPQVPAPELAKRLKDARALADLPNVTAARARLLKEAAADLPFASLLAAARVRTAPATLRDTTLRLARRNADVDNYLASLSSQNRGNYATLNNEPQNAAIFNNLDQRAQQMQIEGKNTTRVGRDVAANTLKANGKEWLDQATKKEAARTEVTVSLTPMVPLWLPSAAGGERLALVRLVEIEGWEKCQGVLLDVEALRAELTPEAADQFPDASLLPAREAAGASEDDWRMAALPFRLDAIPDGAAAADPGWTTLRVGLALAWAAALVALLAVGLGGWSLLDLSERRIRFVSAVTHELRTPLTTLRLYLDMLTGGLVRDPVQRDEYIHTLHGEADRLHRLIGNVLDFSRLEKQRPRPVRTQVAVAELLARLQTTWQHRCADAGKELVIEGGPAEATLWTDPELVEQVLGNLIDNACKYSRSADDPRLWLRFRMDGGRPALEVEDRGPGVPARERRSIFRPFRRGRGVDATAGGVGLGLALAQRWAELLGGRLTLCTPACGACFRVELPAVGKGER